MLLAGAVESAAQTDAEATVAAIWNAYESLEFEVAEARIADALAMYQSFVPSQLSEIHVVYALLLYAQDDLPGAETQLKQALQLRPATTLDPVETPPGLLAVFGRLKEEQAAINAATTEAEVRYLLVQDLRAGAAIRSMVLPGWGQRYKQEQKKGVLLMGLWGGTAGGALFAHIQRQQAKNHYDNSSTSAEALSRFDAFSTWHKVRNSLLLGAAGVWLFSYADAILTGAPLTVQPGDQQAFSINIQPQYGSTGLNISWKF